MEIPREQVQYRPSMAEQAARFGVLACLLLALTSLAFGLGWVLKGTQDDDGGTTVPQQQAANSTGDNANGALLDEIYSVLSSQYVDKEILTEDKILTAAIDGVIASLNDPHTSYIPPEDVAAGALELNSSYQGIGATVSDTTGQVTIVAPFRDSPAEAAGIKSGDIILEVDGELTDGWSDQEAVQRIRGPVGTEVTLKVKHLDGTTQDVTITRGEIPLQSVWTEPNLEVIPGESDLAIVDRTGAEATDIGYIAITQFHDKTLDELRQALDGIEDKGYKGLIIDVRGNPGGLLGATVEVADEFLDDGIVLSEVDADGQTQSWAAHSGGLATEIPIVVLQDASSASGAEVLAAALRDNGRAKIVGTRSFGKGTVNLPVQLQECGQAECGILYISIGRWLSPSSEEIEGVGVRPDFEVEMTADQYVEEGDIQLFKAIEILRGN